MEVDPYFAPPDPSGEITLPVAPQSPDRPSTNARAAMVVVVALVAFAGLFFVGRWTTGGERNTLADERDAAQLERDQLQSSLDAAQSDLADATETNIANQSTIDELGSAATRDSAQLADLQAAVTSLTEQSAKLQDSNNELLGDVDAVAECGNSVDLANTALDKWDAMTDVLDEYLQTEVGSDAERDAQKRLDQAWADIDDAESDFVASSSRCTQAIDMLPDCPVESVGIRMSSQMHDSPCLTTE